MTILTSITPLGGYNRSTGGGYSFVGSLIPALVETAPDGYLLCNGQAVSRTLYANLFAVLGTTFGEGDGSTTFNLPDLRSRFIKGKEDSETLGQLNEAGLPNITGEASLEGNSRTGAFKDKGSDSGQLHDGWKYQNTIISFSAADSNPIYGASDTVTPKNISVNWFIKF